MIKYTIIIPAYNAAKHIKIPLNSLTSQTFTNFEVLIIDDGSSDNTDKVVKAYTDKYENFKYYRKANGNWGSVINYVIRRDLIKGEYVTILDSDDFFDWDCLYKVDRHISAADILVTSMYWQYGTKRKKANPFFSRRSKKIAARKAHTPMSTPHGKFYSTNLFLNAPRLNEGVSYQDTILYNGLLTQTDAIYYLKKPLATWWKDREGNSTTIPWDEKRMHVWMDICEELLKYNNKGINGWVLMYLWELNRNTKVNFPVRTIALDTKSISFAWLPFGTRCLAKKYFLWRTKKWRRKYA